MKVVLSDRRTGLTLHVDDEHGHRTREYAAIVFSTDKERWKNGWGYLRAYVPPSSELMGGARLNAHLQPGARVPSSSAASSTAIQKRSTQDFPSTPSRAETAPWKWLRVFFSKSI